VLLPDATAGERRQWSQSSADIGLSIPLCVVLKQESTLLLGSGLLKFRFFVHVMVRHMKNGPIPFPNDVKRLPKYGQSVQMEVSIMDLTRCRWLGAEAKTGADLSGAARARRRVQ
jgi:hypothetical protein